MEVHVSLVDRKDLSGEIYRQLRGAILDGRLRPGDPLPPTRELAKSLNVSRNTVTVAYDLLWGEGFVTSRVGAGTFVSEHVPKAPTIAAANRTQGALTPRPVWESIPVSSVFRRPALFDFRSGIPDATLFPYETWRRLMMEQLRAEAAGVGVYADPAGMPRLRAAIARYIAISRGVHASPDDVVITNGTQQALDVIARALLEPGDTIAVESPGYAPPQFLFRSLGLVVQQVPVDRHGLVVDQLSAKARVVYVTPSHQYPLGMSMSLQRRMALLGWATEHNAAIVEDDYDSEFRFGGRPIEPLQILDTSGRVIYVGTFSKVMLPTLRLGFIVTPPALRHALQAAKFVADWHSPVATQAALASFIDGGGFARHIRKMRSVYERRHDLIRGLLAHDFSDYLEVIPSAAGLHVTALAHNAAADQMVAVVRRASGLGVELHDLSRIAAEASGPPGLILGYGAIATDRIEAGLSLLRGCFED